MVTGMSTEGGGESPQTRFQYDVQGERLCSIGLRQSRANSSPPMRKRSPSAKSLLERGCGGAKNFVASGVARTCR